MSDSLRSQGLQHPRLPCPSLTPRADSNSCPSSQWCHPTISSSVIPFSSCLRSFPASGSFPMSSSHQFSSVAQSCLTLCDPMNHSTPGFPVHHQLSESTQTHVHWVDDAIQTSCRPLLLLPLIFPSIRVFSNESVVPIRWPEYRSFSFSISPPMNIQDWFTLGWTGWISLQSKGLSRVFFNTSVQQHQFFGAQLSL